MGTTRNVSLAAREYIFTDLDYMKEVCYVNETRTSTEILHESYGKRLVALIIAIIGFIGNTTIAILFWKKSGRVNFHLLVMMLSIYDNLAILMNLSLFIIPNLIKSEANVQEIIQTENDFIPFTFPVLEFALTSSIYFTVAITVERYLIVCHPFYAISRRWPIKTYMFSISLFCLVYNIPRSLELKTLECQNGKIDTSSLCANDPQSWKSFFINHSHNCSFTQNMLVFTDVGCSSWYFYVYHIGLESIFEFIIPFSLLVIMNGLIIKNILSKIQLQNPITKWRNKRSIANQKTSNNKSFPRTDSVTRMNKEDMKRAITSVIIVAIFIVCYSIIWVSRVYQLLNESNTNICMLKRSLIYGYIFTTINSSIKCYAYFFMHYNPIKYLKSLYARKKSISDAKTISTAG